MVTTAEILLVAHTSRYKMKHTFSKFKSLVLKAALRPVGEHTLLLVLTENGDFYGLSLPKLDVAFHHSVDMEKGFR